MYKKRDWREEFGLEVPTHNAKVASIIGRLTPTELEEFEDGTACMTFWIPRSDLDRLNDEELSCLFYNISLVGDVFDWQVVCEEDGKVLIRLDGETRGYHDEPF